MKIIKNIIKTVTIVTVASVGATAVFSKVFQSKPIAQKIDYMSDKKGHVKFNVLLTGGAKYIKSDDFEYAELKCRFGGMEVYFDEATLHEGKGLVCIDSSYGGVELYVPKDWKVVNDINVAMGAVEFMNEPVGENPNKELRLIGNVSLGAVEIRYV